MSKKPFKVCYNEKKTNVIKCTVNSVFLLIVLVCTIIWSCTDEEDDINFKSAYRNESGTSLSVLGFNFDDELLYAYELGNGESSPVYETPAPSFLGANCGADSIVVTFQNGKGYICDLRLTGNDFCFNGKNPLAGVDEYFRELEAIFFEFVITQENFENAFDLPE